MHARRFASAMVACAVVLIASSARARDFDVDPTSFEAALSGLAPGDNVRLAAGTYDHFTIAGVVGTAAMPITISGPADGSAVVVADSGPCCNTIQINGNVSYIVLRSLTIDGRGVDGAFGIDARGPEVHHVTIEDCTFINHGAAQQTVAISTKTPTSGWVIRGNRIMDAGTGMYLGNSDGRYPFVGGLIENNLFYDTIGYNFQIKWQQPHDPVPGAADSPPYTIIRHNVFIKTDRPSEDGDRPNLLVGGFAQSGPNSDDTYQIYGNVFVHNPRESHIQASGRVSIHDNVFLDTPNAAITLANHDLPLRRAWVYNNTFFVAGTGIRVGSSSEGTTIVGNLIFAGTPISGSPTEQRDNVTDSLANASMYVSAPGMSLGSVDFYPNGARAMGTALDLSAFSSDVDFDRDFNCASKGDRLFRGAYAGSGANPGWMLAMELKPECGSAIPVRPDGGPSAGTDGGPPIPGTDGGSRVPGAGGGCGCRALASEPSTGPFAAIATAGFALALLRRARRR